MWKKLGRFFVKLFSIFRTRSGMDRFVEEYKNDAIKIITEGMKQNSGAGFHYWKDWAWQMMAQRLASQGKEIRGTWITILIHSAYETAMAELEEHFQKGA